MGTHKKIEGHFLTRHPSWGFYNNMLSNCYMKDNRAYPRYGGVGITVCQRWIDDFRNFVVDLGERSKGTFLGRIDAEGDFNAENCRWMTLAQLRKVKGANVQNKIGVKGVSVTPSGRFRAFVCRNYRTYYLGCFGSVEEAYAATLDQALVERKIAGCKKTHR
jgi:hypothetical protein